MNINRRRKDFSLGFTTASGSSINDPNISLSKAKESFINEIADIDNCEDTSEMQRKSNEIKLQLSNVAFQTADERIEVSNGPLTKAELLLQEEINGFTTGSTDLGFQTASGRSIKISNEALSKAEELFKKDFEEFKIDPKNVGFQTASGRSIKISNEALLKAEELFKKDFDEFKTESENVGFQTASGQSIKISNEALAKAEELFKKDFEEFKVDPKNVGFQTASGQSIKISNKALAEAEELFKKDFDEFETESENVEFQTASGQSIKISNEALANTEELFKKDFEEFKVDPENVGFQTASGQSIKISNEALAKAEELFQKDFDEFKTASENVGFQTASGQSIKISNEALAKAEELFQKDFDEFKTASENVGFQTASGQSIKISNEALAKAEELFKDDFDEFKIESKNVGFQTTGDQSIKISNEALSKAGELFKKAIEEFQGEPSEAKTLFQEKISRIPESSPVLTRPLQKRKINDLDDNVSLHGQRKPNQFKKLRFSNEFQNPRPLQNNAMDINSKGKERHRSLFICSSTSSCSNDNLNVNTDKSERNMKSTDVVDNSLISHEIAASTVALLADEIDFNSSMQWSSPSDIKETDDTVNVPSSPVIGGQFMAKKRKSTGGRKKGLNNMKNKKNKLVDVDKLKEINDNFGCPAQHINEESKRSIGKPISTDEAEKCRPSVVNDYGDTQLMLDFINQTGTILEKRIQAALEQDKQIALKQKNRPKPTISKLYFHKKSNANNRVSWKTVSKGNKPILCTYRELIERKLPPDILDITSNNATAYKFRCTDFYGQSIVQNNIDGINMEDGAYLILDENGYAGIVEITRSFLASPGVDPNLLPDGWVKNHYKWIVWKLASIDRIKLGPVVLPRALTPNRVIMELKYRYDREIDRSQRSALRKILEKDDVPSKRMVLCVSSITEHNDSIGASGSPNQLKAPSKKLMVTDGWYSIQASVDQAMMRNIISGKIKEGTKLLTYGAELLNCDQGYPPLEAPETVCLKLHTNSTRRARWDIKLGYIAPTGPICIKLRTICHNGGLIGKIKVSIARVYPLLYHQKTSTGESIFRNARCEEKVNIAHEQECRSIIEAFYAKAEKYFSGEKRKDDSNTDSIDLVANEWNKGCEKLSKEKFLSSQELQQLRTECHMKEEIFRKKLESRLQATLPPPRQTTPMLKIRIIENDTSAILAIWSPSEEVIDILKEGNCISILNLMPSLRRGGELQLTANRSTIFRKLNVSSINHPHRTYTALCDINIATFAPAYGEFDTVGIVTCIRNEPFGMKNFEAVFLAYPRADSQSSYLSILFWQGISSHGYAEILTVGSSVACGNLEWRRAASWSIPIAYCTERSIFTRNPRQSHLQQPFADLKHLVTDVNAYVDMCTVDVSKEMQKKSMTRLSDQYTPDKNNFDKSPTNANIICDRQFTNQELPGSSLASNQTAKSAAIQKRIEKLQYYGEPPSLSPVVLKNSSKRVSLEFQSPLKSTDEKRNRNHTSLKAKYTQNSR